LDIKELKQQQKDLVSWALFLVAFVIVLITSTSVLFPAFLLKSLGGFENLSGINPFETGIWTYPFLLTNFIVFGMLILYLKNKLPRLITVPVKLLFNLEISAQVAFFVITILLGFYIIFTVNELTNNEYDADYYDRVKCWLENWTITDFRDNGGLGNYVGLFLLTSSMKIFGNYKVVPFIGSIALLLLTYLLTVEISKKRFAGIVSMVIVLQSGIFLMYDTSVTYPNFWILFYLFSLYLVYKKWPISPISYVLSALSKPLTLAFLPMTAFFIYHSSVSRVTKILLAVCYAVIVVVGVAILSISSGGLPKILEFSSHDFIGGFTVVSSEFRFDGLVLLFLLPLTAGLFLASKKGMAHADSIMFLILGMLLSAPFMQGFSDLITAPYRFIPLIVFFAIGVGILLSKRIKEAI